MNIPSFFTIIALMIATCGSNHGIPNEQVYYKAKEQIKKNNAVIGYSVSVLKKPDFKILISNENIPFDLSSVETDVIKSKYINGFNPFNDYNNEELSIIKKVNDSLVKRNKELNSNFKPKYVEDVSEEKLKDIDFVLFFSEIVENEVYAQLIPYNNSINKDIYYENINYGKAFTFLFKLNNHFDIVDEYSSEVNLN